MPKNWAFSTYQRRASLAPLEDVDGLWKVNYGSEPELLVGFA